MIASRWTAPEVETRAPLLLLLLGDASEAAPALDAYGDALVVLIAALGGGRGGLLANVVCVSVDAGDSSQVKCDCRGENVALVLCARLEVAPLLPRDVVVVGATAAFVDDTPSPPAEVPSIMRLNAAAC